MRKIDIDELKKLQINILDEVHSCCMRHNINYWLDSGTLLGAIRHNGQRPWDDENDIGMLRPEYKKFRKVFTQQNHRYKFVFA